MSTEPRKRKRARASRRDPSSPQLRSLAYLLVELPELPPIEPELGDLVVLDEPEPIEPVDEPDEPDVPDELLPEVLPLVPEVLPLELDLLKCASHSERETWPSLLVSTDEKLGADELPLELELGELVLDDPPAAPVDELDGEADEPLLDELDGEADEPLLDLSPAATASVERAKSTAAEVTVTDLSIEYLLMRVGSDP